MIKSFFAFARILSLVGALLAASYFGSSVSFGFDGKSYDLHAAGVVFAIGVLYYGYSAIASLFRWMTSLFSFGKPPHERGVDSLQLAMSALMLKDKKLAEMGMRNARKYLGDIPIIFWIEGQLKLLNNDVHGAKSVFYSMCKHEKNTVFGAYSLCQMAMKDDSQSDALNAIDSILRISPQAFELALKAIAISIRIKKFAKARRYLLFMNKSPKKDRVEATILHEEGVQTSNAHLLKKAFKIDPGFSKNAICYADLLLQQGEHRAARSVLLDSFAKLPNPLVFDRYISCGTDLSLLDKMKMAERIINVAPQSWIGYYGFANLAFEKEMLQVALRNFSAAYERGPYDFIAEKLTKTAEILKEQNCEMAEGIVPNPSNPKRVRFVWRCSDCGREEPFWVAVCAGCDDVAGYVFVKDDSMNAYNSCLPVPEENGFFSKK